MNINLLSALTKEELKLIEQSMSIMDNYYSSEEKLLQYNNGSDDDVRGSSHYALGLLMRDNPGDLERACEVIKRVIEMQYDAPNEIYHGTFKVTQNQPTPPMGNMNWKEFSPGFAFYLDSTFEKIKNELIDIVTKEAHIFDKKVVGGYFDKAVNRVLPKVWESYDPNWREFIISTFAVILELFEVRLPKALVEQMDIACKRAVSASIDRYHSDAIPMNTNIVLMHIFIVGYFGERYSNNEWIEHAEKEASNTYNDYMEFKSFAEFNSTTYYGVDLMILGLWRKLLKSEKLVEIGVELEDGLWENIALFYNPNLRNVSGPFARCYEMDMVEHSSLGQFIYMAIEDEAYLTEENTETSHDPVIALSGSNMPEHLKPYFIKHQKDRQVEKKFRELIERGKPGENRTLCTTTAWIENDIMLGAMSGSRNTSGQLHPVTIYWKAPNGKVCSIRLLRRLKGGHWSQHLRTVMYNSKAQKDRITVEVDFSINEDIELFFEIDADKPETDQMSPEKWVLPGLTANIKASAPQPKIALANGKLEVIYQYNASDASNKKMNFEITIER